MLFDVALALLLAFVMVMLRRTQMPASLRSVVAVTFGLFAVAVVISICSLAAARVIHLTLNHIPASYFAVNLGYVVLAGLVGGWVAGDIAPTGQHILHGIVLAVVIAAFSMYSFLHPLAGQPMWSRLGLAAVPSLAAIAGSALAPRRLRI